MQLARVAAPRTVAERATTRTRARTNCRRVCLLIWSRKPNAGICSCLLICLSSCNWLGDFDGGALSFDCMSLLHGGFAFSFDVDLRFTSSRVRETRRDRFRAAHTNRSIHNARRASSRSLYCHMDSARALRTCHSIVLSHPRKSASDA
jgi:hypothetical protein